ncbi:hypothetical protein, partial [Microbacterium gubbeenense]|uniref:hypothetical protein n=1 Tax=Microbacterium gubbeenense TaxID=159896 RepID=UPI001B7FBD1B
FHHRKASTSSPRPPRRWLVNRRLHPHPRRAPLLGTSMVSASDDVDVTISWESQEILDSSGDSVDIVWVQEDSAQEMGVGELPGGERVEVTKQSALPVPEELLNPPEGEVGLQSKAEPERDFGDVEAGEVRLDEPTIEVGEAEAVLADPAEFDVQSISAVTDSTFSYAWDGVGDVYEVSRDGELIAETETPEFTDALLTAGQEYLYEITSYDDSGDVVASRSIPTRALGGPQELSTMTYQPHVSQGIYRTFIPDKFVSMDFATTWGCGQAFKKDRMFGGDNRSYTMPTRSAPYDGVSSKTSVALNINWENSAPYKIQWVKEVGTTRLYENYKLIDSATASSDGIKIIDVSTTSAYAQARIDHKVANPYCIAGAITYNVMFRWYRNGTFEGSSYLSV